MTFNTIYVLRGGFQTRVLTNIRDPPNLVIVLGEALNHGSVKNTWMMYRMTANHVEQNRLDSGINLIFIFSLKDIIIYILVSPVCQTCARSLA